MPGGFGSDANESGPRASAPRPSGVSAAETGPAPVRVWTLVPLAGTETDAELDGLAGRLVGHLGRTHEAPDG